MCGKQKGQVSFSLKGGLKRFGLHTVRQHLFVFILIFQFYQKVRKENLDLGNLLALSYKYINTEMFTYHLKSL